MKLNKVNTPLTKRITELKCIYIKINTNGILYIMYIMYYEIYILGYTMYLIQSPEDK